MEQYPSNSQKPKTTESKPAREKLQKAVEGPVLRRKTPIGKRIKGFAADDAKGILASVVQDILVPKAKEMFVDSVSQAAQRTAYGSVISAAMPKPGQANTNYTRYQSFGQAVMKPDPRPTLSQRARATHDFGEIILATRAEAEMILQRLFESINDFNTASVADLYDLVGFTSEFTDNTWGWTDLSTAGIQPVRGGYLLILPRPEPLG